MSKILGYFKERETAQFYAPEMVRDCLGGEKCTAADAVCCLAGGDSHASSAGIKSLPDGLYCVCSGRLVNGRELWGNFSKGIRPNERTDALLCLLLFNKYGDEFARRLNGPFCVAVYHESEGRLWLYRDHLGQHPFYFSRLSNGYTIFSDDLARLRWLPGCPSIVSVKGVSDFLSLGYIPSPETIYYGIAKLAPGSCLGLHVGGGVPVLHRYWRPVFAPKAHIRFEEAVAGAWSLLEKAVERCLAVEPKAAVLLSGGIDSNLVMALCTTAKHPVDLSYTVGFKDAAYDERELAARSAEYLHVRNRQHEVVPADWSMLRSLQKLNGEPFGDSSIIPTTAAMSLGIGEIRCVLTGAGGDELFGGYRRYQALCWRRLTRWLPEKVTRWLAGRLAACLPAYEDARTRLATIRRFAEFMAKSSLDGYFSFQEIFSGDMKQSLLADGRAAGVVSPQADAERLLAMRTSVDYVERFNELDVLTYLPDDGGRKETLAGAHSGLLHLSPLLDVEVAEFALSLPRSLRVTTTARKRVLREIGKALLMPELLKQAKWGFGMPVSAWLRGPKSELLRELVGDLRNWDTQGWFQPAAVQKLVDEHLSGRRDHGARLWNLLCLRAFFE